MKTFRAGLHLFAYDVRHSLPLAVTLGICVLAFLLVMLVLTAAVILL